MAGAGCNDAVQPLVSTGRCFKDGLDPEVVALWIDNLTFLESLYHLGWPMANTAVRHGDRRVVVGLQNPAYVERSAAITAHDLPIAASIQHFSGQSVAFERPRWDDTDTTKRSWGSADNNDRLDVESHDKQWARLHAFNWCWKALEEWSGHVSPRE
jgi:hypothetical protein